MSNSIKLLLGAVVLVAIGAAAVFVILPGAERTHGPDATLAAAEVSGDRPSFQSNLLPGPVGEAEVIDQIPADVPGADGGAAEAADHAEAPAERSGRPVEITGRVLDGAGRPVEGAAVSFVREPMAMMARSRNAEAERPADALVATMTDREGRFSLHGRAPRHSSGSDGGGFLSMSRDPQLIVQHESFATLIHSCSSLEPDAWDAGDLVLEPGAWIVGRVVDSAGRALAGAAVSGSNVGEEGGRRRGLRVFGLSLFGDLAQQLDTVESGTDGRFTLRGLMPGLARVTASKQGLRLGTIEDVELEARVPVDVGVIVLEAGVSIAGVVLDERGEPLEGATVSVSSMARLVINRIEDLPRGQIGQEMGQRAVTDEAGGFELGGLAGGTYNVHASADGYATLTRADVAAGTHDLRLQPEKLGGLLVTLVSGRDGQPVRGATIGATSTGGWGRWRPGASSPVLEGQDALAAAGTQGDPEGVYLVQYAGLESTELTVAAEGFGTVKSEAPPVTSGGIGTMTIELQPESVVAGHVLDAEGNPIARARISMSAIQPQQDGRFAFGRRGARFSREINIHVNDDADEEAPPDAERLHTRTGFDGSFEIRGGAAGEWELTASADAYAASQPVPLTLADGQEQRDVEIELVRAGSVAGYVTEVDGTPVDDARVVVQTRSAPAEPETGRGRIEAQFARLMGGGGSRGPWRARSDVEGRYEVLGLAPGEYEVKLDSGPGGRGMRGMMVFIGDDAAPARTPAAWTTVVEGVESRVDLVRPKRAVVRGRVTAGGQPAADLAVRLRADSPFAFGGESARTDAFGEYEFTDVEAGDYVVSGIVPGAALEEKTKLKVGPGQTVNADLIFGGATLSGRVVDKSSGFGVRDVTLTAAPTSDGGGDDGGAGAVTMGIQIVTADRGGPGGPSGMSIDVGGGPVSTVKTDASGNFELKYLKPGRYSVEASGGGYTTGSIGPFDVTDGEDKDGLLIEVQLGAVVEGLVHSGETGERLDKVPVRLSGGGTREMSVTDDGAYRFEGLEPGEYTLEVLGSGWGADAIAGEAVTLEQGEVRKLDLVTGS